jgi:hypothetical protein
VGLRKGVEAKQEGDLADIGEPGEIMAVVARDATLGMIFRIALRPILGHIAGHGLLLLLRALLARP